MSDLIYELSASNENCWGHNDGILEGHRFDEIYTCLDCVENGVRKAERKRIIELLKEMKLFVYYGVSQDGKILSSVFTPEVLIRDDVIALIEGKTK